MIKNKKVRQAVGAIIIKNSKYILVRKVKMMDGKNGPKKIPPIWDFPKGGIKSGENPKVAIIRELQEEIGNNHFKIKKRFKNDFCFNFDSEIAKKINFSSQKTIMFLVEYQGEIKDLVCDNNEIDKIKFFSKDEILKKLTFDNSKKYFNKILKSID